MPRLWLRTPTMPLRMGGVMRYFRNAKGTMVHREDCRKRPAFPIWWNWADEKTVDDIVVESARHGIVHKFCRFCFPELRP
jgi:hypothetical protein